MGIYGLWVWGVISDGLEYTSLMILPCVNHAMRCQLGNKLCRCGSKPWTWRSGRRPLEAMKAWTVPPSHSQHSLVTQIYHQQNILGAQTLKNWTSSISVEIGQVYIYIHNTVTWLGLIRPKESLHFTKQLRQNQRALSPTAWPAKGLSKKAPLHLEGIFPIIPTSFPRNFHHRYVVDHFPPQKKRWIPGKGFGKGLISQEDTNIFAQGAHKLGALKA